MFQDIPDTLSEDTTGEETTKVYYGMTSLKPNEASAEHLLALRRGHGAIENKSH